jgi:hypothetical protein
LLINDYKNIKYLINLMNTLNDMNINKRKTSSNNFQPQLLSLEKQCLPQSLLEELCSDDLETSEMNFSKPTFHMPQPMELKTLQLNMSPLRSFNQPKRKVHSHQNVNNFYSGGLMGHPQFIQPQMMNPMCSSHPMNQMPIFNNPGIRQPEQQQFFDPYGYNGERMFANLGVSNVDSNLFITLDSSVNTFASENDFIKLKQMGKFHPPHKKNVSSCNVLDSFRKNSFHNAPLKPPRKKNPSSDSIVGDFVKRKSIDEECLEEELEEFLERMGNDFIPFIKTQKGSRSMQKYLNKITPDRINNLLEKISLNFREIMCDSYGNYFIQKLIQCCSSSQRIYMLKCVR